MNDATNTVSDLAATGGASYRVLARKYRPATFADLIGQDAMVRTISNAFETGRIPQAWILTGVRGVGKTTTARILARALNYELPDGSVKGPTIHMPVLGLHDQAIMESRHVDVIEMDAASHNGVDDVRQINDAVRYSPVSARYKVYILDEVHMLSGAAFNALLKTLEEPPPHVKFVFATTEIRKVPITVLSRCQRFDLRRVDAGVLVQHLETICRKEGIAAEGDALALIARAAEGSVRDALSLTDQAIAHAAGSVRSEDVRQMLGLADRTRVIDLFEALMRGDMGKALGELRDQYDSGADPAVVLSDLAEFTNFVTRVKVVPAVAEDPSLAEVERTRGRAFAAQLSMRVLARTWQMLFKGLAEVQEAAKPLAAAEMVLVRIAYAADLPTPDEVMREIQGSVQGNTQGNTHGNIQGNIQGNGGGAAAPASANGGAVPRAGAAPRLDPPRAAPRAALAPAQLVTAQVPDISAMRAVETAPTLAVASFPALIALAGEKRDMLMKSALERDVRLVRFEDGKLEIALEPSARKTLVSDLQQKLTQWTGRRWVVVVSREAGEATVSAQLAAQRSELEQGVRADPLVQAVLARFPGAEIVGVTRRNGAPEAAPTDDVPMPSPDDYGASDVDDEL
ncbi:MAG TPA: DNA polymerase III subunit gamma/tau [Xanthobacteraceae bacterium]|nr:DNA polymerase III subunit gamma/tau [Xanthobacteraceae bacterium]